MLRPQPLPPIPAETARIARAASPQAHPDLRAPDELGEVCTDAAFAALFPHRGQPAHAPWRLALATVLQFAEGLSDRQAAHAVRARLDWQDVLRPEPDDAGFAASVLCAFRSRLVAGEAAWLRFKALLTWARTRQLLRVRGRQRTDSTRVLDSRAVAAPARRRAHCPPNWSERYGRRLEDADLPKGQAACAAFTLLVGGDGHALLAALYTPTAPA